MISTYPPAPQHLRAACLHPDGHLIGNVSAATLQVYLDDDLVYRNDGDRYRLPPGTAQKKWRRTVLHHRRGEAARS
ncbi:MULTISPECIES: hypothetical protein [Streptomyces]|uniref:Uncharacterized protein n=3 Tax=Streptomyces TaxID=1883 RepID=A0ABW1E3E2_9ACTN|nr:hypothetical protein [Streptomyces hirsutus]WSD09713.1 hypothetical protein OIE73_30925 [Streptomyces hirsutus]